jgi:hypothetical protein
MNFHVINVIKLFKTLMELFNTAALLKQDHYVSRATSALVFTREFFIGVCW